MEKLTPPAVASRTHFPIGGDTGMLAKTLPELLQWRISVRERGSTLSAIRFALPIFRRPGSRLACLLTACRLHGSR